MLGSSYRTEEESCNSGREGKEGAMEEENTIDNLDKDKSNTRPNVMRPHVTHLTQHRPPTLTEQEARVRMDCDQMDWEPSTEEDGQRQAEEGRRRDKRTTAEQRGGKGEEAARPRQGAQFHTQL